MSDSLHSSDLSDPPTDGSDGEDELSTPIASSRPSIDYGHGGDHDGPPTKRRRTGASLLERTALAQPVDDDAISVSSDGYSSAPGSPDDSEWHMKDHAQLHCQWRDCDFAGGVNNDDLVKHVQRMHCATGGPKKSKYTCEWGECQRKASNHPSGYALKAHMRSHTKEKPYYCLLPGRKIVR